MDRSHGRSARRPVKQVAGPVLAALLALALLARVSPAEETPAGAAPEPLTLAGAVDLALRNSPVLKESRANQEAARAAGRQAGLSRLPAVELKETAVRTDSPADVFGMKLMQERFSFPSFVASDPNRPEPLNNFSSQVEATVPLFTGGQLSGGIRQASRMAASSEAMTEHTTGAVELGVVEAYLNALLADRFVELAAKARETTARHLQKAQDFFDTGMIVESDLLQARVQLASMDEDLIKAQGASRLARAGLNRALGVAQDRSFALTEPPPAESLGLGLDDAIRRAAGGRKDLLAVERKVEAAQAGIGRARGEYWPQLGAAARYSWNDDRLFGTHGGSYTLAAMAQWKIWNWGQTRAKVSQSRSEYAAAREGQRSYQQQVEFEVRSAWEGVEEARARRDVSAGAVQAAERALSILEDRFGQGIARVTDLLDAETMADQSRVREAQARYDLEKSIRALRFAVGLSPVEGISQ